MHTARHSFSGVILTFFSNFGGPRGKLLLAMMCFIIKKTARDCKQTTYFFILLRKYYTFKHLKKKKSFFVQRVSKQLNTDSLITLIFVKTLLEHKTLVYSKLKLLSLPITRPSRAVPETRLKTVRPTD